MLIRYGQTIHTQSGDYLWGWVIADDNGSLFAAVFCNYYTKAGAEAGALRTMREKLVDQIANRGGQCNG